MSKVYKIKESAFDIVDGTCDWCGVKCKKERICIRALCDSCQAKATKFWDDFYKRLFYNLDDYSIVQLVDRHRNVLDLAEDKRLLGDGRAAYILAQLLIGTHYGSDVWSSRGSSGVVAGLFGSDYLLCYCASSTYVELMLVPNDDEKKLISAFNKADALDEVWRKKNETISRKKSIQDAKGLME